MAVYIRNVHLDNILLNEIYDDKIFYLLKNNNIPIINIIYNFNIKQLYFPLSFILYNYEFKKYDHGSVKNTFERIFMYDFDIFLNDEKYLIKDLIDNFTEKILNYDLDENLIYEFIYIKKYLSYAKGIYISFKCTKMSHIFSFVAHEELKLKVIIIKKMLI